MSEKWRQICIASLLVLGLVSLIMAEADDGQEEENELVPRLRRPAGTRHYTTRDLMHSIMNFYSTRKNNKSGFERGNRRIETGGADDRNVAAGEEKRDGLSFTEVKHIAKPRDEQQCQKVCYFCKAVLSMRWAALCSAQCYKGGHE